MFGIFFGSLMLGYSGALMPGPLLTYTIDQSMRHGKKAGFIISIGHAILEFLLVILLLKGVGQFLEKPLAQTIIAVVGGLVLCYLGIIMLRDIYLNKISMDFGNKPQGSKGSLITSGIIVSASNPYFIFWWAVVGLNMIINANNSYGITGVALFYLGHILSDISWYSLISVVIGKTRDFVNFKAYKIVVGVLGLFLIGFGLKFIIGNIHFIKL